VRPAARSHANCAAPRAPWRAHGIDIGATEIRGGNGSPVAQLETEAAMGIGMGDGLLLAAAYGLDAG
jgi:hypothetical protein